MASDSFLGEGVWGELCDDNLTRYLWCSFTGVQFLLDVIYLMDCIKDCVEIDLLFCGVCPSDIPKLKLRTII